MMSPITPTQAPSIDDYFLFGITNGPRDRRTITGWLGREGQAGESLIEALIRNDLLIPAAHRIVRACQVAHVTLPPRQRLFSPAGHDWLTRHLGDEAEANGHPAFMVERVPGLRYASEPSWGADVDPADPVRTVGSFRLHQVLGSGAAGVVYEAASVYGGERVALKLLHAREVVGNTVAERYLRGAAVAGQLGQIGCLPVHAADREFGYAFVVSPKVEGGSHADRHEKERLSATEATALCGQAARVLADVHAAGYAHGNIKPGNLLLGPNGVILADLALPPAGVVPGSSAVPKLQAEDVAALVRVYANLLAESPSVPSACRKLARREYATAVALADALKAASETFASHTSTEVVSLPRTTETLIDEPIIEAPKIGDLLRKCLLTGKLGEGATGIVFKAAHQTLGIDVAVKVLSAVSRVQTDLSVLFSAEARMLARLNHPNIVRIWDFEAKSKHPPFLVLEYVDGKNLEELIKERGAISSPEALSIFTQVISALAAAHQQTGLIHRDIKPANILIGSNGVVKVADLGLASIMDSQTVVSNKIAGTVAYMAPERFANEHASDFRADIYALGVTLFEAVVGVRPYGGNNVLELMIQHVEGAIPEAHRHRAGISPLLSSVIQRMMAKSPKDRFQTYDDLLRSLTDLEAATPVPEENFDLALTPAPKKQSILRRLFAR